MACSIHYTAIVPDSSKVKPTFKDIASMVLARDGSAADVPRDTPRRTLRKAVEHLRSLGRPDFADHLAQVALADVRPGARLPKLGEERTYIAQRSNRDDFARIPTGPIGVVKGGSVRARFFDRPDDLESWVQVNASDRPFVVLVAAESP